MNVFVRLMNTLYIAVMINNDKFSYENLNDWVKWSKNTVLNYGFWKSHK